MIKITGSVPFFLQNMHDYKCDIDLIQQVNKQYVNIKRLAF